MIDEPGDYYLDRDWYFTPWTDNADVPPNVDCGPVSIRSDGVRLDMRGFSLNGGKYWGSDEAIVIIDTPDSVAIANGGIIGDEVSIRATVPASHPGCAIGLEDVGRPWRGRAREPPGVGYWRWFLLRERRGERSQRRVGQFGKRLARIDCYESVCFNAQGSRVEFARNDVTSVRARRW